MTDRNKKRAEFEDFWRDTRGERKARRELVPHEDQPQTYICGSANRHYVTWCAAKAPAAPTQAEFAPPAAEPVAWRYQTPTGWHATTDPSAAMRVSAHHPVEPLYTAPPAPTEQWLSVAERLPEPGNPVLLDIGKRTPIRAMWAAKHTVEVAADDESDFGEYDEERDVYYCPEGWYEWNQNEEVHWAVAETALHWQPMPAPPQGAAKGATA